MTRKQYSLTAAVAAIVLIAGALLHAGILSRRAGRLADLNGRRADLERRIALSRQVRDDPQLQQKARSLRSDNAGELLHDTTRAMLSLGIGEHNLKAGAPVDDGAIRRLPVSLVFKSSLPATFALIDQLSQREQPIHFRRVDMSRDPRDTTGRLSVTIEMDAYESTPPRSR